MPGKKIFSYLDIMTKEKEGKILSGKIITNIFIIYKTFSKVF